MYLLFELGGDDNSRTFSNLKTKKMVTIKKIE